MVLLKYISKEGVIAAAVKEISTIFKVNSVYFVPKSRNNYEEASQSFSSDHHKKNSFSAVLDRAAEKEAQTSLNCQTYTYGANLEPRHFLYQSKEYTY